MEFREMLSIEDEKRNDTSTKIQRIKNKTRKWIV